MKIVINTCFGGFSLSEKAYEEMGLKWDGYGFAREIERNDPKLIATIEKLGEEADGSCADLCIIEIPDDINWKIDCYDGKERVVEPYMQWN